MKKTITEEQLEEACKKMFEDYPYTVKEGIYISTNEETGEEEVYDVVEVICDNFKFLMSKNGITYKKLMKTALDNGVIFMDITKR